MYIKSNTISVVKNLSGPPSLANLTAPNKELPNSISSPTFVVHKLILQTIKKFSTALRVKVTLSCFKRRPLNFTRI